MDSKDSRQSAPTSDDTKWHEALARLQAHLYQRDVEPHVQALREVCNRLAGDSAAAEDLHQEALIRGLLAARDFCRPMRSPRAYLTRTARNLWVDKVRKRGETIMAEPPESPVSPPDHDRRDVTLAAERLARLLPPREYEAFVLREIAGLTSSEAAEQLGTTTAAVKMAVVRGRRRLRNATGLGPRGLPEDVAV